MLNIRITLSWRKQSFEFRNIHMSDTANLFITRKNSLTKNEFVQIKKGDYFQVQLNKNEDVSGCVFNAAMTYGCLLMEGNTNYIKKLSTNFIEKEKKILVLSVPFTQTINSSNGCLKLCYADDNCSPTETSRFIKYKPKKIPDKVIELESLIVRTSLV